MEDSFRIALQEFVDLAKQQVIGKGVKDSKSLHQYIPDRYHGLKVEWSLGQGRAASVPWISFLAEGQSTSRGIYPVFLFYLKQNILILAFGVSESKSSDLEWPVIDSQTIGEFFLRKHHLKISKYSRSKVFKSYDTSAALNFDMIDKNLADITKLYITVLSKLHNSVDFSVVAKSRKSSQSEKRELSAFECSHFHRSATDYGLSLRKDLILRFAIALLTKPFVILTGLSGSGKTKLATTFAHWICHSIGQHKIIAIGADWTNRDPLLGYPDALRPGEYVKPDNGVLDLIISAGNNPENPYFLILDEMNLSHVERYFADFLSAMELSDRERSIPLHSSSGDNTIPQRLNLPKNLFIVGTVNIDETTYMFSPKVLDRANVIEFRIEPKEMEAYLDSAASLNLDSLIGKGSGMAKDFVRISQEPTILQPEIKTKLAKELNHFFSGLQTAGAEFGYRSASEILRFASIVHLLEPTKNIDWIMDAAIMQKLLPKLHGSRRKLSSVLETLAGFCWADNPMKLETMIKTANWPSFSELPNCKYPISLEKLLRMYKNLVDNGFTSYAEA